MPRLFCFTILFLCFSCIGRAQNFDTVCLQQKHVLSRLKAEHFSPPEFNEETNAGVLDLFIRETDEKNTLFLSGDREALLYTVNNSPQTFVHCLLIKQTYTLLTTRALQIDSILSIIEKKPLYFKRGDTITFSSAHEPPQLCTSLSALQDRIKRRIQYECLVDATLPGKEQMLAEDQNNAAFLNVVEKTKQRSIKKLRRYLARFSEQQLVQHLGDCMSNALALRCDPHSNFFNRRALESYHGSLYTQETSFGFSVAEDEYGNIIIDALVPGGPAWKSNVLSEKDVIVSFSFPGQEETKTEDTGLREFHELLYHSPGDEITIKTRSQDLSLREVVLRKERIESLENNISSYIISKNNQKIAYISIPTFYLAEESVSGLGCANDVAKEIVAMRNDSIDGLVIDIRYNGGGAMREAIALAGLFIDEGPMAVFKPRGAAPFVLKDIHRGVVYEGPVLVLVNAASASASEFFAGTMKDYNRAVIAGSATFGKTSAQNLVPADSSFLESGQQDPAFGVLKITTGKFYRLNGTSSQASGLVPDVEIPGLVENVMEKEMRYPFHLLRDTVYKKPAFDAFVPLPLAELRRRSEERLNTQPQFRKIRILGDSLLCAKRDKEKMALNYGTFKRYSLRQTLFNLDIIEAFSAGDTTAFSINNYAAAADLVAMSDFRRRLNEQALHSLKKDIIFHESIFILSDLITLTR